MKKMQGCIYHQKRLFPKYFTWKEYEKLIEVKHFCRFLIDNQIEGCEQDKLAFVFKNIDMQQGLIGYKKEYKQAVKKLSNPMFILILSFKSDIDFNRRLLNSLSSTCQEMAYNANMLNILNDQNETRPRKLAMIDEGAIFSQSSFYDGNWRNPRLDSGTGFHSQNNRGGVDHWCMV